MIANSPFQAFKDREQCQDLIHMLCCEKGWDTSWFRQPLCLTRTTSAGDVNCHCLSFLQIDHVDPTLSPEVYLLHPSRKLLAQAVSWPPVSPLRIRCRVCPPRTSIAAHLSGALLEATASLGARSSLPGFTFGSIGRAMLKGKKKTKSNLLMLQADVFMIKRGIHYWRGFCCRYFGWKPEGFRLSHWLPSN